MRMFPYYCDENEKYKVAVKCGNKRKSGNFYYQHIGYSGVKFVKRAEDAQSSPSKEEAEFLIGYLQKRIEEVGFILRYK